MRIKVFKQIIIDAWRSIKLGYLSSRHDRFGEFHDSSCILMPFYGNKSNIFMEEDTNIGENATFVNSHGRFFLKKFSTIGPHLMVIAQNHNYFKVGKYPGCKDWQSGSIPDDVHVDDYVWIGANVTLCPGVHIPRGCIVAAGSVCVKSREYLPYTVIGGNPAKMIKYRLSLEEQLEQENLVVPPPERIPEGVLRYNWNKFMRQT